MIEDPDIFRAAVLLIGQHGQDAVLHAKRRANELGRTGENRGSIIWHQIAVAIQELQCDSPQDETVIETAICLPPVGRSRAAYRKAVDRLGFQPTTRRSKVSREALALGSNRVTNW
jgi:hypothetical protein